MCEIDAKGNLADVFESGPLAFAPREVAPGLLAMAMDTEESLREYLKLQLKVPLFGRIGPLARTFDFVADAAPGVKEILTVGKLCYEVREATYDLVVVDASATGHVVGQLAAPQAINELVKVGRVRDQTRWMVDLLSDPAIDRRRHRVARPRRCRSARPSSWSSGSRTETDVVLAGVIVNKVLPELFGRGEEEIFDRAARAGGPRRPWRPPSAEAGRSTRCSTPPSWRSRSGAPGPVTSPACREGLSRERAAALRAVPVHPRPTACARPAALAEALGAEMGY